MRRYGPSQRYYACRRRCFCQRPARRSKLPVIRLRLPARWPYHIPDMTAPGANAIAQVGLIAGEGEFPKLVLAGAQRAGLRVVVVGLRDCCPPEVRDGADV